MTQTGTADSALLALLFSDAAKEYVMEYGNSGIDVLDLQSVRKTGRQRKLLIPTGVSACSFFRELIGKYAPRDADVEVVPVINRYFGETITVTGLIVGCDLVRTLEGKNCDEILLCDTVLRENTDSFLDDMTLSEVRKCLGIPVRIMHSNGESLVRALWGMEEQYG